MSVIHTNKSGEQPVGADRNKTELTLRITEAASSWLHNLGAKCVETEVYAGPSWLADIAGFWSPTQTEASYAKLIPPRVRYPFGEGPAKMRRYEEADAVRIAAFAALPPRITIVHEVKTSRADFAKDAKWGREAVADMQVLSYARGILQPGELPAGWWALEHSAETGALLGVRMRAPIRATSLEQHLLVIANLAERRHNRTANQYLSDLQKRSRVEEADRRVNDRLSGCMRAVLEIARGESASAEETLRYRFSGKKIPSWIIDELKKMHGVLKMETK